MSLRSAVKSIPVIGTVARKLNAKLRGRPTVPFANSGQYWEDRYRLGGNSGAGSYSRLAQFKAEVLNGFVADHDIKTVLEIGCGDGAQLALARYPSYVGVDVSHLVVRATKAKFADRNNIEIIHSSEMNASTKADLTLSLDVIYHLVEDSVFDSYMRSLFDASSKFVIIYASNKDEQTEFVHVRHRRFTDWIKANRSDFSLIDHIPNRYPFDIRNPDHTSFADFYVFGR